MASIAPPRSTSLAAAFPVDVAMNKLVVPRSSRKIAVIIKGLPFGGGNAALITMNNGLRSKSTIGK